MLIQKNEYINTKFVGRTSSQNRKRCPKWNARYGKVIAFLLFFSFYDGSQKTSSWAGRGHKIRLGSTGLVHIVTFQAKQPLENT